MEFKAWIIVCIALWCCLTCGISVNVEFMDNIVQRIQYSPEQLRSVSSTDTAIQAMKFKIPKELKRRKRGKASGIKKRLKTRKFKPFIPSIIMGNVQSLANKLDELHGNVKYMHEFRNASLMSFTETG